MEPLYEVPRQPPPRVQSQLLHIYTHRSDDLKSLVYKMPLVFTVMFLDVFTSFLCYTVWLLVQTV